MSADIDIGRAAHAHSQAHGITVLVDWRLQTAKVQGRGGWMERIDEACLILQCVDHFFAIQLLFCDDPVVLLECVEASAVAGCFVAEQLLIRREWF